MSDSNLITPAEAVVSQLIARGHMDESNSYILSDYARMAAELGTDTEEFYTVHYGYDPETDDYLSPNGRRLAELLEALI